MDPITDIFNTMHVMTVIHSRIEATAPWGVKRKDEEVTKATVSGKMVSPAELAHLGMVSRGNCWLSVDAIREPIPLTAGDCFLVAPKTSFTLRDNPRTRPMNFCDLAPKTKNHVVHHGGGGTPTTIISGLLSFDSVSLKPLAQLLPGLILVKADPGAHACVAQYIAVACLGDGRINSGRRNASATAGRSSVYPDPSHPYRIRGRKP